MDLPRHRSVPGSVGSRRRRRWPDPRGQDVEHVEGAGAGGQSVSIGDSCGPGPRGAAAEGPGQGVPARGVVRGTPPASAGPVMAAAGGCSPGPRSHRRGWEGTLPVPVPNTLCRPSCLRPCPNPGVWSLRPEEGRAVRGWVSALARVLSRLPALGFASRASREGLGGGGRLALALSVLRVYSTGRS